MLELEREILRKITPIKLERRRVNAVIEELVERASKAIKALRINALPLVVGSVAKDTWLKKPDIDIFILFPLATERKKLEEQGLEIGRRVLPKGERKYAEHPYTSGLYKGYAIDIVPCYKIEHPEQRLSAVDRTPLHTEYVLKNLAREQKKEVRLLKQFLKGIGCYGAEAQVQGFSGYLCELLILKYKNFKKLVREVQSWRAPKRVELVKSKAVFDSPLVVIDPVDPSRNVASALSSEKFGVFVHLCKEYLKEPRKEFFFPKELKPLTPAQLLKKLAERGTNLLALEFEKPALIPDNLYPQLRKCRDAILKLCSQHDFKIFNSDFYVNKNVLMIFEFEVFELPLVKKHFGPELWNENSKRFLAKWKKSKTALSKPYLEDGRWVIDIKREFTSAQDLIQTKVSTLSLGKDIGRIINKKFRILSQKELVQNKYIKPLTAFLDKRFCWEY